MDTRKRTEQASVQVLFVLTGAHAFDAYANIHIVKLGNLFQDKALSTDNVLRHRLEI